MLSVEGGIFNNPQSTIHNHKIAPPPPVEVKHPRKKTSAWLMGMDVAFAVLRTLVIRRDDLLDMLVGQDIGPLALVEMLRARRRVFTFPPP